MKNEPKLITVGFDFSIAILNKNNSQVIEIEETNKKIDNGPQLKSSYLVFSSFILFVYVDI